MRLNLGRNHSLYVDEDVAVFWGFVVIVCVGIVGMTAYNITEVLHKPCEPSPPVERLRQ